MHQQALLVLIVFTIVVIFLVWKNKEVPEKDIEEYHRYRSGRYGWYGWGWPYRYRAWATSWPPYLYGRRGYGYRWAPGDRCEDVNEADDCDPARPMKIGKDTDGDGTKDKWQCCRRYY